MTELNQNNIRSISHMHNEDSRSSVVASFSTEDFIKTLFRNWYWFVISTIFCLCVGVLYIKTTPKVYKRDATILVKDSRKGGSNDILAFQDLIGTGRRNVDNELFVLQSRRLMEEVVERLGLATSYKQAGTFVDTDLYHRSPIDISVVDDFEDKGCGFEVTLLGGDNISVTQFEAKEITSRHERNFVAKGIFGDTLSTPVGKVVIAKTAFMNPEFEGKVIRVGKGSHKAVASLYRKAVQSVVANKQSSIIKLSINDNVPQRAEDILNTLIEVYNDDAVRDKQKVAEVTAEFIDERLGIISKDLGAVDKEIESFKKDNKLFDLEAEAKHIMAESSTFRSEGLSVENQLRIAEYIRTYLNDSSKAYSLIPVTSSFSGSSGSALNTQISEYNRVVLQRERLVTEGSSSNPVVLDMDRNLAAMRNGILAALSSHISALDIQLRNIRAEENKTDRRISVAPSQEKQFLSIARQQRIKEELYLYLLNKREENSLTLAITESNARIVDPAFGSSRPVSPRTLVTLLAALILGFLIPFGIIYLHMTFSTTVKSRKDLERNLSAPYIGDIPTAIDNAINSKGIAVRENGRDNISESFRMLRTNLNFMSVTESTGGKVIQSLSTLPHAGKTFIATNLAMTLAMSGKKVLLMDLDLRRRTLTKKFGHRGDANGVSAYMSGVVKNLSDIISKSDLHDNLDMMYAGLQPPNPAEMLMSQRLDDMFEQLRTMYDYIVIDSVPAMSVADGIITNRFADICLYVIRENYSDIRQLPDVERLYVEKKIKNMCVLLNGSTLKHGYGYYYSYGLDDTLANSNIVVRAFKKAFFRNKKHE